MSEFSYTLSFRGLASHVERLDDVSYEKAVLHVWRERRELSNAEYSLKVVFHRRFLQSCPVWHDWG